MGSCQRQLRFLVPLLLAVTTAELSLNRIAVAALRPPGEIDPPAWHAALDHVALFLQYFATTLALAVLAVQIADLLRDREVYQAAPRYALVTLGTGFATLAAVTLVTVPGATVTFLFESAFTALLVALVLAQLTRRGQLGAKLGIALLAAPLIVHYYGPLASRTIAGEDALWGGLPETVQQVGQWSVVLAALASPYCFAPRPLAHAMSRLTPAIAGLGVGVVGAVVLRRSYEVGMLLASRGLGIDLGPGAPTSLIALYLLALATIAWTLVSCLTAATESRRRIGAGIALVVVGGYGFSWPLQYLASAVGLVAISGAARRVGDEERAERRSCQRFRAPPIDDAAWQSYVGELLAALRSAASGEPSAITTRSRGDATETRIHCERHGVAVSIRIERAEAAIAAIEVSCGDAAEVGAGRESEPAWTLEARPESLLAAAHPEPPPTSAPAIRSGDEPFDRRFRIRGTAEITAALLDDGMRARAAALLDGWLAVWPAWGLRYRVHPGQGAPLDHPIPITELAFRGSDAPASVDRLITLIDFLATLQSRRTA